MIMQYVNKLYVLVFLKLENQLTILTNTCTHTAELYMLVLESPVFQ